MKIIFINPDYHCSFFYRDEFRKLGWEADIYVPYNYPDKLLYSSIDILKEPTSKIPFLGQKINNYIRLFKKGLFILKIIIKYDYHFYYGGIEQLSFYEDKLGLRYLFGKSFRFSLFLAKILKKKIINLPSGIPDEDMPEVVIKLGNEQAGLKNKDSKKMADWFDIIRKYADLNIAGMPFYSSQYRSLHIKYKSIHLGLWKRDMAIPDQYRIPRTKNLVILHSSMYAAERKKKLGGDIKGSKYVLAAINRLIDEGFKIESLFLEGIHSNKMRFYQAQADIVVEQLIRGWWGSTGVETMALGKPVVCYLRPEWKVGFFKDFPEYNKLPIVESNTETIYEVLKKLVINTDYRLRKGEESRRFAEKHFDIVKNTQEMKRLLKHL